MKHRVIVVEDNLPFAIDLELNLLSWGHEVQRVFDNGETFLEEYEALKPTLIILDINLNGELTGVLAAEKIKDTSIPIIFITARNDMETFNSINLPNSIAFLVKPFDMLTLKGMIDFQFSKVEPNVKDLDFLYLKKKNAWIKLNIMDISHLKSDGNYCNIYVKERVYTEKISMSKLLLRLDDTVFLKIHKSYAVNTSLITKISHKKNIVTIDNVEITIGRKYKKELISKLDFNQKKLT